ncbi:hypothetical protein CBM2589_B120375 [Cupriavidus taiwanensis]|uniref:Uncharacterized protein n=1 Tax=Cupriavidus taiwanensis TaxID=164546 RepID=A0A975WUK0_9BURK|nr:hypothetical protein CBM2589_B120375 [Cupriavidus taiwanensis]
MCANRKCKLFKWHGRWMSLRLDVKSLHDAGVEIESARRAAELDKALRLQWLEPEHGNAARWTGKALPDQP